MRVALLSSASSIHTIQWANGLSAAGVDVHVISQHPVLDEPVDSNVTFHFIPFRGALGYFTMVPEVKKILCQVNPDVVNAHYASGYATTARLVGYRPWLLSVWGSDVYQFPYASAIHKWWLVGNLKSADAIASTSHCMATQTRSLSSRLNKISITPFGVNVHRFAPNGSLLNKTKDGKKGLVIGTVKTLAETYGVDILIKSFALLKSNLSATNPELSSMLRLRLVGGGPQRLDLERLAFDLGIQDSVLFVGAVNHQEVPAELHGLDIYVALSRSESFGVAVIEASAAGCPVVVSDAGGLPEVVVNGETGIVVPKEDPQSAAAALEQLVLNSDLRLKMGKAGQKYVKDNYDWGACVAHMIDVYKQTIRDFDCLVK